ncbi:carbon-nitrogen hydrolase family protein [Micromonospora sp. NPDC049801]|uniref:carbon-nitrogen hydrolase family protein n=1 Tax=unclassified Micromonospora TaxID=2617518 RepID=UPI002E2C2375|nr:carbon-nitrogen hydrolase family protein [Micromonospora sp. NBC_00330]
MLDARRMDDSSTLTIAAAQPPVTCDATLNGTAIRALMRRARQQGAYLVQFPEGALSGYAGQAKDHFAGWNVDWTMLRRELDKTAALAGELGLWVILGSNHRLSGEHRPHNSLYVISDQGRIVDRYDKRYLSHTEITRFYTPGFTPSVLDIAGFKLGLALCIEINFPEMFLDYLHRGVDCVLFSTFSEDPMFAVIAQGHAATMSQWVSVSVPAQCSTAMPTGIIGPHGGWLARCAPDGTADLVCATLDRDAPELRIAVQHARPWRTTARDGAIYRQRRVDDPRSHNRTEG